MKKSASRSIAILLISIFIFQFVPFQNTRVEAAASYNVQGTTLPLAAWPDGGASYGTSNCWAFAQMVYKTVWGVGFSSYRGTADDILRNVATGSARAITADNTKKFISFAALGSTIRITNNIEGSDVNGTYLHSQILVQKDTYGFTIYDSVNTGIRIRYYSWAQYASTYANYQYFKYIKYPNAPAYSADSTPPSGNWISPTQGNAIRTSGPINLSVNANDNVSMARVTFHAFYDGIWHELGTDSHGGNGTYGFTWNYNIAPQDVLLHAHLYDANGNYTNIEGPTVKAAYLPGAPTLTVPAVNSPSAKVVFSWSPTSNTTHYDLRISQNGTVIKTIFSIVGSSYAIQLPSGNYTANLCSVNSNYLEWWTSGNTVSFSVNYLPMTAPKNLTAKSLSNGSIQLAWGAVAGATAYDIYRSMTPVGGYTLLATSSSNSYTNSNLKFATKYYYKVKAKVNTGTTYLHSAASTYIGAITAPTKPSHIYAATSLNGKILSWSSVAGARGYAVYRSEQINGTYTMQFKTTYTSALLTSLSVGKTYYYKVKAYTIMGSTAVYGYPVGPLAIKM